MSSLITKLSDRAETQLERCQSEFTDYLYSQKDEIERVVSKYLRLDQHCEVSHSSQWKYGGYNVCIPILVTGSSAQRLALKYPLAYRFKDQYDLMDEKIRCEAGTFTWISQNCSRVPIPGLWGFGDSQGRDFMSVSRLPWYRRAPLFLETFWAWLFGQPICRPFVPFRRQSSLKSGYILMDYVEQGVMLSSVIPPSTPQLKQNLYKSVARIILDLAQPVSKIGSFTIDSQGYMSLSNRPLTRTLANLEIEGIPIGIPRGRCYLEIGAYLHDLLYCHDLRLIHKSDSIRSECDGEGQIAVLTAMRRLIAPLTSRQLTYRSSDSAVGTARATNFVFTMTDFNTSNFLVDHQFNIISLIDLEWFCSLPMGVLTPLYCLTGHVLDDLLEDEEHPESNDVTQANLRIFKEMCEDFLAVYMEEDASQQPLLEAGFRSSVMRTAVEQQTHWLWLALSNPEILYNIFMEHIQPIFAPSHLFNPQATHFQKTFAPYWSKDASLFLRQKPKSPEA